MQQAIVGLRPSFSAHVRFGEHGALVHSLSTCFKGRSKVRGKLTVMDENQGQMNAGQTQPEKPKKGSGGRDRTLCVFPGRLFWPGIQRFS